MADGRAGQAAYERPTVGTVCHYCWAWWGRAHKSEKCSDQWRDENTDRLVVCMCGCRRA